MDYRTIVDKYQESYLSDLDSLIRIESTRDLSTAKDNAPFGMNCRKALDTMLTIAQRDGFVTKDIDGYAGVIEYGQGEETLGMLGHLDIVPIGEDWTKDPLKVTLSDGYLFGRGVMDDKGPSMAAYYALKIIKDLNIPLKKRVMLIMGCDEESGMECMDYYVKHAEIPQMGFVPDANYPVVYGEKGGLHVVLKSQVPTAIVKMKAGTRPNIVIGKADCYVKEISDQQRKLFDFYCNSQQVHGSIEEEGELIKLHIDGTFAHAAMPYKGVNAALLLLNFVGAAYQDTLASTLYSLLKDWQGQPLGIDIDGMYMSFLTMNTGIVSIENNNTEILLDIRYPNDTNADEIMDHFHQTLKKLPISIQAELKHDSKPLFVDPESKLVKDLMNVYRKYTKDTFSCPITLGGGTYARKFENFVSYGPEFPNDIVTTDQFVGACHQRDEGIKLEHLMISIAIYIEAIVSLAG